MNNMIRANIMAIIFAMLATGGCSWLTNLIITNSTVDAISLVYVLKPFDLAQNNPDTGLKKGYQYEPPRIIPVDHFDKLPTEYPEATHTFDMKTGTVTVTLAPKSTV